MKFIQHLHHTWNFSVVAAGVDSGVLLIGCKYWDVFICIDSIYHRMKGWNCVSVYGSSSIFEPTLQKFSQKTIIDFFIVRQKSLICFWPAKELSPSQFVIRDCPCLQYFGILCIMELFCQSNKITIYNLNAYKKSLPAFFWGCSKKLLIWKFQKISRKTSLVEFFLSNWSCPIYRLQLYWKLTPSQMFLVSISRIFKTAVRISLMKRFLSKVAREVSAYYNSVENSVTWIFLIK